MLRRRTGLFFLRVLLRKTQKKARKATFSPIFFPREKPTHRPPELSKFRMPAARHENKGNPAMPGAASCCWSEDTHAASCMQISRNGSHYRKPTPRPWVCENPSLAVHENSASGFLFFFFTKKVLGLQRTRRVTSVRLPSIFACHRPRKQAPPACRSQMCTRRSSSAPPPPPHPQRLSWHVARPRDSRSQFFPRRRRNSPRNPRSRRRLLELHRTRKRRDCRCNDR